MEDVYTTKTLVRYLIHTHEEKNKKTQRLDETTCKM